MVIYKYIDDTTNLNFILIVGSCVGQFLSATPDSRNVSVGTLVEFTCMCFSRDWTEFFQFNYYTIH